MPRLRATMTFEYDADPENYESFEGDTLVTPTVAGMAAFDLASFEDDFFHFAEYAAGHDVKITVEPVEDPS